MTEPVSTETPLKPHVQLNKAALLAALRTGGAVKATVHYSGRGDEGQIQDVTFETEPGRDFDADSLVTVLDANAVFRNHKWEYDRAEVVKPIRDALLDFANDVVETHYIGWENGEGAFGEVIFELGADGVDVVRIEHNECFVDSELDETTL